MLKVLHLFDFYGVSENVEIAKGKYELPLTFRAAWKQKVRELKYKKHGRKEDN